jgi:hypothetical protein
MDNSRLVRVPHGRPPASPAMPPRRTGTLPVDPLRHKGNQSCTRRAQAQAGDQSTIHAPSPTISNTLRAIAPGRASTMRPNPSARMRFLAATRASMPLQSMNVRSERSTTTVEPAISTKAPASQSADTMSNSPCSATTWTSGSWRAVRLKSGTTAKPFPPKVAGGRLPGDRSAVFRLPPLRQRRTQLQDAVLLTSGECGRRR